jgi:predicted Zn-dependent protease with MMP-like domain
MAVDLKHLRGLAQTEVGATIARLPARLRRHAERLPVTYEACPNQAIIADGYDPDLLGLFVGKPFDEEESGGVDLPAQIILFLECLWEFSEEDEEIFIDEVATTYLHELGHYLGLDEIDLEERGLE